MYVRYHKSRGHEQLVPPRLLPVTMLSLVSLFDDSQMLYCHCKYIYTDSAPSHSFSPATHTMHVGLRDKGTQNVGVLRQDT